MLQYTQTHLAIPSNVIELTEADLVQVSGGAIGCGGIGGGFGGFGCGDGWGWGGGLNNIIIININSFNSRRGRVW